VCGPCLEKSRYLFSVGKRFSNGECILDDRNPKKIKHVNELPDSDDDNAASNNATKPSTSDPDDPKIAKLKGILKETVRPLLAKQDELCTNHLISERDKLAAENDKINNFMPEAGERFSELYKELYKFDGQRKFKFDKEISIVDDPTGDGEVAITKNIWLPGLPDELPAKVKQIRHLLKKGDKVYGMKQSLLYPWIEATIKFAVSETGRDFNIIFDDGEERVLNYKNLAYINTSSQAQFPVGSRVIAKFKDINIQLTNKFYVGVISEPPKYLNNFRYV